MKKLNFISSFIIFLFLLTSCQTVKNKTDAIVEKENEKLSKFICKSSSDLQIDLCKINEDFENEEGNLVFVYNTKKYGIQQKYCFKIIKCKGKLFCEAIFYGFSAKATITS